MDNRLSLNVRKTKYLIIAPNGNRIKPNVSVTINNTQIKRVTRGPDAEKSVKFLGLHLDENLTWDSHINAISRKISHSLYAMNLAKHILPSSAMIMLYHALVESHITYGIVAWGNSPASRRLEKLQKQAMRIIFRMPYRAHCDPLFKSSRILKVKDIYNLNISLIGYDYLHNLLPDSFRDFYPTSAASMITRQSFNIPAKTPRTRYSSVTVFHEIPRIWNSLPIDIKTQERRNAFKNKCKDMYLNTYLASVVCNNPHCRQCSS